MARQIIPINCINVVFAGNCAGIVAINCIDKTFTSNDNGKIFISNSVINTSASILVNASTGPPTVDGTIGLYYIDASGSPMPVYLGNPTLLKDCRVSFYRLDGSANNITFTDFGGEKLNLAALPQVLIPTQKDCITLTSDGTDWFIIK